MKKNVLIIYGGGGNEHEISVRSKNYLVETIAQTESCPSVYEVEIRKDKKWYYQNKEVHLLTNHHLVNSQGESIVHIHYAIPCIHGYPGETGELPAFFQMIGLPFLGNDHERSSLAFNKVSTKLWLEKFGVPVTPYLFLIDKRNIDFAPINSFWEQHGSCFVKASSEGSSVACYPIKNQKELLPAIQEAFNFSNEVLVEKLLTGREFELSVYEIDGKTYASYPGEIVCPSKFYSYNEKYDNNSTTKTLAKAQNLDQSFVEELQSLALKTFRVLNLKHLCRIDFLTDENNQIYVNEPNTFPGLTSISLFPQMMEQNGHLFKDFLNYHIAQE